MCIFLIQLLFCFVLFIFPLPGWTLDAARLSCQDSAKEVVASSFCKVVEFPSMQGVQPLWSGNSFPCSVVFLLLLLLKGPTLLVPGN